MIDIKFPIGLMFSILGALLAIYGWVTFPDPVVYEKALNLNINLWMGAGMLVFGLIMLSLSKWRKADADQ